MGYEDVEVTQPSNDKGVDVKAVAQFGITTINEVIQVKRHRANIQRPVLDMLRGSLHRFKAQKGTIITTGDYGKGAKDAAFEMGAAPITLINGDTLIDLLIQHEIGVKKKTVDYYEVDETPSRPKSPERLKEWLVRRPARTRIRSRSEKPSTGRPNRSEPSEFWRKSLVMDIASLSIMGVIVVMAGISMFAAEVTKECAKPAVRFRLRAIKGTSSCHRRRSNTANY